MIVELDPLRHCGTGHQIDGYWEVEEIPNEFLPVKYQGQPVAGATYNFETKNYHYELSDDLATLRNAGLLDSRLLVEHEIVQLHDGPAKVPYTRYIELYDVNPSLDA